MQSKGYWTFLVAALLLTACGGPMGRAVERFESTQYPGSLDVLERMEADAQHFEPRARTRYCLYRGLTHLALGNAKLASRWLGRTRQELGQDPDRLSQVDRSRLESAWRSLGLMPGDPVVVD